MPEALSKCAQQDLSPRPGIGAMSSGDGVFDLSPLLTGLHAGIIRRDYEAEEIIYSQGAPADAVFWIQSGEVKLTVVSKQGKEAVVGLLGNGSFFGEACLGGRMERLKTAVAVQPSQIVRIAIETMVSLLHREPKFADRFMAYLLSRNMRIEEDLVDQLFNPSERRLARLLLLLANFGREEDQIPKISQETLAEMVGTTRSRVSFFLNRFRKLGFIDYNGGIRVFRSLVDVVAQD